MWEACMLQVHRDVQPRNLVWSDGVSRWRLTGCESWARKGSDAPLSYSLRYAAPEVGLVPNCFSQLLVSVTHAVRTALKYFTCPTPTSGSRHYKLEPCMTATQRGYSGHAMVLAAAGCYGGLHGRGDAAADGGCCQGC